MSTLRPYKFLVAPVVQVVDEEGNVTGEAGVERPDEVYGTDGLLRYAEQFADALAAKSKQMDQQLALRNGRARDT